MGMFFVQLAWALAGNNQPSAVVRVKLGFTLDEWTSKYNRLISSSSIAGVVISGVSASSTLQYGRKNVIVWFGVLAIVGTILTLITNVWVIILGRFLHGISVGIFMAVGPRMMNEFIPLHLLSHFGPYVGLYIGVAFMIVQLLGIGLPQGDELTDE